MDDRVAWTWRHWAALALGALLWIVLWYGVGALLWFVLTLR